MNRRTFITTAAVVSTAAIVTNSLPALAQDSSREATPKPFIITNDGQILEAGRHFGATEPTVDSPIRFDTTCYLFDTVTHANDAFEKTTKLVENLVGLTNASSGLEWLILGRKDVAAPNLGFARDAEVVEVDTKTEDIIFQVAALRVQTGTILHLWLALGVASPVEELFDLARKAMKFFAVDADDDKSVLSLLPTLVDMPKGFVISDESVVRGVEQNEP